MTIVPSSLLPSSTFPLQGSLALRFLSEDRSSPRLPATLLHLSPACSGCNSGHTVARWMGRERERL